MSPLTLLIAVCCLLALTLFLLSRANELFAGRFEQGRFEMTRGRCPGSLEEELNDVARLEDLDGIRVSVRSMSGRPRLTAFGAISDGQLQQLRNVIGRFQVSQIRRGSRRP